MTKQEMSNAYMLAMSDKDLQAFETSIFDGFGLPGFEVVYVTISQIAKLIRWQCFRLDGSIDSEALNDIGVLGKKRFRVIGE